MRAPTKLTLVLLFFLSACTLWGTTVKIAVLNNFPPFSFVNRGELMGFTLDYLDLISEKSDIEFELVPGTWTENLSRFKQGEVDCITAISYTEKRTSFARFTEPYYLIPTVVYIRQGDFEYNGVKDLYGKKVGIETDIYYEEYLREHGKIALYEIESTDELMKELSFGNIDAVVTNINIGNFMIKKHLLVNVTLAGRLNIPEIKDEDLRIGVRKEKPKLLSSLHTAINKITPDEYKALQDKWVSFAPEEITNILTPRERALVNSLEETYGGIRFCAHPAWRPIDFINPGKQHRGIIADILGQLSKQQELNFSLEPTESFDQSITMLEQGKCDVIPAIIPTPEHTDRLTISNPYMHLPLVIATRNEEFFINDLRQVQNKRIGLVQGRSYHYLFSSKYPQLDFVPVESVAGGLEKVQNGSLFALVDTVPSIAFAITEKGLFNIKIAGRLTETVPISFAVRPGKEVLNGILSKAFSQVTDREKQDLVNRWITLKVEERIDYSILWKVLGGVAIGVGIILLWIRNVKKYNSLLSEKNSELERLSITDQLTGMYNRGKLDTELSEELARADRYKRPFTILLLDIDYFKLINDNHGHQVGDEVLKDIASIIRNQIRTTDTAGRWGGEEFLILCPETSLEGGKALAEKIRKAIEAHQYTIDGGITTSLGVTEYNDRDSMETLVKRADKALYEAKETGRNRTVAV